MGKNKTGLGRALVKDRFGSSRGKKTVDNGCMLHTTEVQDGYDWGRLNLQSVTEESSFQEFLSTAQLAGTEFQAEKLNLRLITLDASDAVTTPEARASAEKRHAAAKHLLRVPRRPLWKKDMTPEHLQDNERQAFLDWRRDLAALQEKEGLLLTPYEKNLEFWRQLWRVLEKSQLFVQVLDARNPLLFRCEDLEAYAREIGVKASLLLLNKADLLSESQRIAWAEYFDKQGIKVAFFSATLAEEIAKAEKKRLQDEEDRDSDYEEASESDPEDDDDDDSNITVIEAQKPPEDSDVSNITPNGSLNEIINDIGKLDDAVEKTADKLKMIEIKLQKVVDILPSEIKIKIREQQILDIKKRNNISVPDENNDLESEDCQSDIKEDDTKLSNEKAVRFTSDTVEPSTSNVDITNEASSSNINWGDKNSSVILTREELIELLKSARTSDNTEARLSVGMVGYPNVGKSSTINALMEAKKVSVSATPGKTKHFQTLFLSDELMLCDCPGLVLPSFVCTKAEMVVHGILPIDQMREYMESVGLLVEGLGGRTSAERRLGLLLPPAPADHPDQLPPRDLLLAYAYSRGMMSGGGVPDCARAARSILRLAAAGQLPLAIPPPGYDADTFRADSYPPLPELKAQDASQRREMTPQEKRALKTGETTEDLDNAFFVGRNQGAHAKGVTGKYYGLPNARMVNGSTVDGAMIAGKPWKQINKHSNKNKKEKLRRVYAHLDLH